MKLQDLVKLWFEKWEEGDFENIPVEDNFTHTSPFGTINGKDAYLGTVDANKESFLGHKFEIHDEIYDNNRACVRYTSKKGDFTMEVTEWFYLGNDQIQKIVSYYNIGNVSYDETLSKPE